MQHTVWRPAGEGHLPVQHSRLCIHAAVWHGHPSGKALSASDDSDRALHSVLTAAHVHQELTPPHVSIRPESRLRRVYS